MEEKFNNHQVIPNAKNSLSKPRNFIIDDLRGLGIFVMIMIHTNVYFLSNKIAYTTLELSQFAVPLFVFCSSYLSFQKELVFTPKTFFEYVKKRFFRLLPPYYIFLAIYLIFTHLKEPKKITEQYVINNILMIGGLDFNWLVFLFLEFTFLTPFLYILRKKRHLLFMIFFITSMFSAVIFLRYTPLPNYRYFMWLPWSLVIIFALFFKELEKNKKFILGSIIISGLLFFLSRTYQDLTAHSLFQYNNKYPPNVYHLSYGIFATLILYKISEYNLLLPFRKLFAYLSKFSYSIYFIHILVIYVVTVFMKIKFNWVSFFVSVLLISLTVQWILNWVFTFFQHYKEGRRSEYLPEHGG